MDTKSKNDHSDLVPYSDTTTTPGQHALLRLLQRAKNPTATDNIGVWLVGKEPIPPHPAILELK